MKNRLGMWIWLMILNGGSIYPPPISVQDKVDDLDEIKDCLDQEISDNEKVSDVNEESIRGVWNMKFADIVKANKIDNKLVEISTKINENGNEVVVLNDEMIESVCEKWKYTICGFFVGGQVTFSEARYHLRRMWNQFVYMDLMKNDGAVFFFKFKDEKEPNKLPIWVKLLNVPMEAWSMKGISDLASSLGKPIIMDEMTARMYAKGEGRLNFARVLIEVEAKKELKKEIEVVYKGSKNYEKFTKKIQVEYAWKPPCCDKCQVFGHDNKSCRFKEKETQGTNVEQNTKNKMSDVDRPFTEVLQWKGDNGKWDYRKKQDTSRENSSGSNEIRRNSNTVNNIDKAKEIHDNIVDKAQGKSTVEEYNMKCNKEKISTSVMKASASNRFTLLNELVGDEDLIPSIEDRKIVDEYMNKEDEEVNIDSQ
ncbi:ATPase, F1/V1/A1 complex, alpha/beta subunit [Tanacetum coccineum]